MDAGAGDDAVIEGIPKPTARRRRYKNPAVVVYCRKELAIKRSTKTGTTLIALRDSPLDLDLIQQPAHHAVLGGKYFASIPAIRGVSAESLARDVRSRAEQPLGRQSR